MNIRARLEKLELIQHRQKPAEVLTPAERSRRTADYLHFAAYKHGLLDMLTSTYDLVALAAKDRVAELMLRAKTRRDCQAKEE